MPIVYEDIVRGRQRSALELPARRSEVLTETFAQAYEENPIAAVSRMLELREDERTGPRLNAEQARARLKEAGLEGAIEVDDNGITEAALATLMERKRIERRRQEIFATSEGGLGQGAARLGVAALTSMADPISAFLNFVPVAGQARYARMLSNAKGIAGRTGVRLGVGAAEGAAGAAIVEPLIYAMRTQEQADYDAVDSLLNVALGGLVGSGLHTTVGSVAEIFARQRTSGSPGTPQEPRNLPERIDQLPKQQQEQLVRTAVAQAVAEGRVDVAPMLDAAERRLVEAEINARLDAEEQRLRAVTEASDADRLSRTYGDIDQALQRAIRTRDEAAAVLSADEARQVAEEAQRLARADPSNRYAQDRAREAGRADDPIHPRIQQQAQDTVARQRREARERLEKANDLISTLRQSLDKANAIRSAEIDLDYLRTHRAMAQTARERAELLPQGLREHFLRRLDKLEESAPSKATAPEVSPDYHAASEAAEVQLKQAAKETPDATPQIVGELADVAEADARALSERLGLRGEDAEMKDVAEAAVKAERWARAAELATVCLVRGG